MSAEETRATYLIVGGGLAASRAVEGIRSLDQSGSIVLVTEEERLPYERPPLSKAALKGDDPVESAFTHEKGWYADNHVDLRVGDPATSLDASENTVTLEDGAVVGYDNLLLATGSSARALDVPGADLDGVLYLRRMPESTALRARFAAGHRMVIVGAGWIGLEVAAAAVEAGCQVTVVEPQPSPLFGVLGPEIGAWFADLHRSHGVKFQFGEGVERLTGEGHVTGVVTKSGPTVPADTVVVGVGISPNTGLAEAAGLQIDNGIVTDSSLRSSDRQVWAAGDVASWLSPTLETHVRVEHWANANDGGYAAGRSMAGSDELYDPIPFFFSDQYDVGLEYAGYVARGAETELVVRGDLASNEFMAFWVVPAEGSDAGGDGVRVLAGMHVNVWDTIDAVQQLVRERTTVDRTRLADPDVALTDLT
ncbi:MAG: FAD-dependent oxidoreductase [Terracoccus sp.]